MVKKVPRTCRLQSHRPTLPSIADTIDDNLDEIEVQEDDTADIALLSEGEPLVVFLSPSLHHFIIVYFVAAIKHSKPSVALGNEKEGAAYINDPRLTGSPTAAYNQASNVGCSRIIPGFKHGRLRRYDASDSREHAKHNGRTRPIPATLKLDMLTTKLETPGIQSHLSGGLLHKKRR
ncbi:hypothetical protein PsorP6_015502 [Peronosclerospora sorghi]|uniref:Uncharacterized protein n=1 Tax=Peronosclerospora sorghi TaxID=230839 RepID=A0ACC0WPE5_9STRA|nr:hypothetical protein PsorP6_015502 [Peronosclerospora sorghi]